MAEEQNQRGTDRRQFLGRTAAASAGILASAFALDLLIPSFAAAKSGGVTSGDVAIVGAAQIAEALAVTTYSNIINQSPFFKRLPEDDQGYLKAARQEEMSHYALEKSVTGKPSPFTTFYYPAKMFSDAQTTLDVLVTLEDAFIAAYLVGVRDFSTPDAARPCGADHGDRERPPYARARPSRRRVGQGRRTDQEDHRRAGQGRKRRSAQQQRVRAHPQVDKHQPGRHGTDPVRRPSSRRPGRVRHVQAVPVQAVHPGAAQPTRRISLIRGLTTSSPPRDDLLAPAELDPISSRACHRDKRLAWARPPHSAAFKRVLAREPTGSRWRQA